MLRFLILTFIFVLPMLGLAQTPADWWYFGQNAGIHFTSSGPVADLDGQVSTSEGVATISDNQGNLLFYTDGINVYNKLHQLMPNGTGLLGNPSSTQSAVCVPRPGSTTDFYIFTMDDGAGVDGLRYTKVDLSLASGLGDVVTSEKNILLVTPCAEKIATLQKPGGFWVVALKIPGDTAYAYEVTSAGVNTIPVLSNTGVTLNTFNFWGYLKPSTSSDRIGFISQGINDIYVFDFNLSSGEVTATTQITQTIGATTGYGIEFSPNGDLLYAMSYGTCDVHQYDLTAGSAAAISATETLVAPTGMTGGGALQLGPDGKMYVCRSGRPYVSAIEFPNVAGIGCSFVDTAVWLENRNCVLGLPTFIQSFFNVSLTASNHCFGDPYTFSFDSTGVDSAFWNFGDPNSGSSNTSTAFQPTHTFSDTGIYTITLIAQLDTLIDTSTATIFVYPRQSIDLGQDARLCTGDSVILDASQPFSSFVWHDSSTNDSFIVYEDLTAWVTVFGVCDTVSDTIQFIFDDSVSIDLGPDTSFCEGGSLFIDADIQVEALVFWNTGDSVDFITVDETGVYVLTATNACGIFQDSIAVDVYPIPDTSLLPEDTVNCFDNAIILEHDDLDGVMYYWSDSSQSAQYEVDTTEVVWLAASNQCGFTVDTINIIFNGEIRTELGEDTVICDEDSIQLFGIDSLATYVWNTGDSSDTVVTIPEVSQNYIVTITLRQCQRVEQRFVESNPLACPPIDCELEAMNVFTPNGDGINDVFRISSDCEIFSYDLYIYNRWGQLVHVSRNKNFGWDGYVNGELASEGVYYYTVEYKDPVVVDADRRVTQGSLTLMRD